MSVSVWEALFFIVVLKIPVIYLAVVVWWAVRAVPEPPDGGEGAAVLTPAAPCGWDEWRRRRTTRFRPVRPAGPRLQRSRAVAR